MGMEAKAARGLRVLRKRSSAPATHCWRVCLSTLTMGEDTARGGVGRVQSRKRKMLPTDQQTYILGVYAHVPETGAAWSAVVSTDSSWAYIRIACLVWHTFVFLCDWPGGGGGRGNIRES